MRMLKRLRWLFFTSTERNEIRQGLSTQRFGNKKVRDMLKELW